MATIGLRDVYYCPLLTDPEGGTATYGPAVRMVGAISATMNPNPSTATLFADDGPLETAATLGEISLDLNMADLTPEILAALLGHTYEDGVLHSHGDDVSPYVAIGFRSLKASGAYKYVWLNKGKFSVPEETYNTKGDSIEFGTPTITGSFVKRISDDEWKRAMDGDDTAVTQAMIDAWFDGPIPVVTPGP